MTRGSVSWLAAGTFGDPKLDEFDSGLLELGSNFELSFDEPGVYSLLHPPSRNASRRHRLMALGPDGLRISAGRQACGRQRTSARR